MMTEPEILDAKLHHLVEQLGDATLIRFADEAGCLLYPPTGKALTPLQLRRRPPGPLLVALARAYADRLEHLSVAIQGGKTVVRERINPEDLRRRAAPTLKFPDP